MYFFLSENKYRPNRMSDIANFNCHKELTNVSQEEIKTTVNSSLL